MPRIEAIVVFASHDFAVPLLDALAAAERAPAVLVTQPAAEDEPVGPPREPPTVEWALDRRIPVLQPAALPDAAVEERLRGADLGLVAGYGELPPAPWLALPKRGFVQVQPSLLPKYRGETAIRAILDEGEKKTGVTVVRMEEEAYAGPILAQEEVEVDAATTYGDLAPRLGALAGRLVLATLAQLEKGEPKGRQQNEKIATEAPRYEKRHDKAPWSQGAERVHNRLRAYAPEPGLKAFFRRRQVRIYAGRPLPWVNAPYGEVGTFLGLRQGRLAVLCGGNSVFGIERIAWRGGESMSAGDFLRQETLRVGDTFV